MTDGRSFKRNIIWVICHWRWLDACPHLGSSTSAIEKVDMAIDRHKSGALVLGIATAILMSAFFISVVGNVLPYKEAGKITGMIE